MQMMKALMHVTSSAGYHGELNNCTKKRLRVRLCVALLPHAVLCEFPEQHTWCGAYLKSFVSFEMEMLRPPFEKLGELIDCFSSSSLMAI